MVKLADVEGVVVTAGGRRRVPPVVGGVVPPVDGGVVPPVDGGVVPPVDGGVVRRWSAASFAARRFVVAGGVGVVVAGGVGLVDAGGVDPDVVPPPEDVLLSPPPPQDATSNASSTAYLRIILTPSPPRARAERRAIQIVFLPSGA